MNKNVAFLFGIFCLLGPCFGMDKQPDSQWDRDPAYDADESGGEEVEKGNGDGRYSTEKKEGGNVSSIQVDKKIIEMSVRRRNLQTEKQK